MRSTYALLFLTILGCLIETTLSESSLACKQPTKHYKSMGCTASNQQSSNGCPANFDCPNLTDRQPNKCYLYGKVYDIGEQIPSEETAGSCNILFCSGFNDTAIFNIAIIDCVEFFFPFGRGCVQQYRKGECCSFGAVCGNSRDHLRTCSVGNDTLFEGQRYNVEGDPCKICICTVDYGGFPVENCYEQKCPFEYSDSESLLQGAAPVYEEGWCCPVDWRLPEDTDRIAKKSCNLEKHDPKCLYGSLTLNVGDVLQSVESDLGNITCRCEIPPLVHCVLDESIKK